MIAAEAHVRAFVHAELVRRGWSQQRLADAVTALGVPMPQSGVSKWWAQLPRSVSADEVVALAEVFEVPVLDLLGVGSSTDREVERLRRVLRRARAVLDEVDA